MLRITAITSGKAAVAYYSSADYYLDENALPARWHGKAAAMLGLQGEVAFDHFTSLCHNRHPDTGHQLTAAMRSNRRAGFDFSFSAPKSVSILYSLAGDDRIAKAFRDSVNDTMRLVEEDAAVRVRKAGSDTDRKTGNLLWADYVHSLSRPVDGTPYPQLHAHAVVLNATFDQEEEQWKAAQIGHIKANGPFYQAVFRAKLAERLQAELGYELDVGKSDFEVRGVPATAIKSFSKRTEQIELLAKKLGITRPESKAKLGATSRVKKAKNLTWEELRGRWHSMISRDDIQAIHFTHEASRTREKRFQQENAVAFQLALVHLLERESVVGECELMTEALRRGLGRVTLEGLREQLGRADLLKAPYEGKPMVTTPTVMQEEIELIAAVRRGRGSQRPISASPPALDGQLSLGQQAAVNHLLTSRDRFTAIKGGAGVGKTTLLKHAKAEMERQGLTVTVLAPSAAASRVTLRADGIETAETLQRFLLDEQMHEHARGGVVILDEASLAGTRDILQLAWLAERQEFRVALLGDRGQHKSVSRGNVLRVLEDFGGVQSVSVTEIRRQRGELKRIVTLLAKGEAAAAFDRLDAMGAIREEGHEALAREYVGVVQQGQQVLCVSPTRIESAQASHAIRAALRRDGLIGDTDRNFVTLVDLYTTEADRRDPATYQQPGLVAQFVRNKGSFKNGQRVRVSEANQERLRMHASAFRLFQESSLPLTEGDRIRISSGGRSRCGHRLDNGATYVVHEFTSKGDIVLNNGWIVGDDFPHVAHDYVCTSFSAQSRTTDVVLVAQSAQSSPASNQAQAYVSLSRARFAAMVFTNSKQALRLAVARPDVKRSAHDIVEWREWLKTILLAKTRLLLRLRRQASLRRRSVFGPNRRGEREASFDTPR